MLTPDYYEDCADDIIELYAQLDEAIIADITRRIIKTGTITETAKWQIKQAQEMGLLYDDIISEIGRRTNATDAHVRALFEDAGVRTVQYDAGIYRQAGLVPVDIRQSPAMMQVLNAGYKKTLGNMKNLTLTTANTSQNAYISACNNAYMKITSGAFSYQEAIRQAIQTAAQQGSTVLYPSGHIDRLDVAVRRAVLTGVGQTCRTISETNADEMGCDLMEISAHSGARPSHAEWQGQIVSLSGRKGYLTKDDIGYGTGAGFGGYNCQHDWYPYFEGISTRNYNDRMLKQMNAKCIEYNGKKYSEYEISQIQRRMEREIRSAKREKVAYQTAVVESSGELKNIMQEELAYANSLVKVKQAKMRDFINQTGQQRQYFREQNYGRVAYSVSDDGLLDKIKSKFNKQNSLTSGADKVIIEYNKDLGFKRIKGIHTQKSDLKKTNPKYSTKLPEYRRNCQRCVNAYEARRRGYDVEAMPRILDGTDRLPKMHDKVNGWTAVYKNPELIFCGGDTQQEMIANVNKNIQSFGENSRAIVRVAWKERGAHVFIAETINGKTKFIDPQTNKTDVEINFSRAKPDSVYIMRVDNLEFTDKIKECCKDRGEKDD